MNQSILLRLPEELGRLMLVDWLDLTGTVRLETALCGRTNREAFRLLARHSFKRLSTAGVDKNALGYAFVRWCMASGWKVDGVSISEAHTKTWETCLAWLVPDLSWASVHGNYSAMLLFLAKHNPNLTEIELVSPSWNDALRGCDLVTFTTACRNMTHLKIARVKIPPDWLARAIANCDHLTHLSLRSVSLPANLALKATVTYLDLSDCGVTSDQLRNIARCCPRLLTLYIFLHYAISGATACDVLHSLPLLQEADVQYISPSRIRRDRRLELLTRYNLREFDSYNVKGLDREVVEAALHGSTQLTRLVARYRDWFGDDTLAVCAEHCPMLEELELSTCPQVTSQGVLQLMRPGNRLRTVVLEYCTQVDDAVVLAAAQHCPLLEVLNCTRTAVTDLHSDALRKGCPHLKRWHH